MASPVPEGGLVRACIISGTDGLMVIDPGQGEVVRGAEHALLGVRTLK
jgi:hypothetical protein